MSRLTKDNKQRILWNFNQFLIKKLEFDEVATAFEKFILRGVKTAYENAGVDYNAICDDMKKASELATKVREAVGAYADFRDPSTQTIRIKPYLVNELKYTEEFVKAIRNILKKLPGSGGSNSWSDYETLRVSFLPVESERIKPHFIAWLCSASVRPVLDYHLQKANEVFEDYEDTFDQVAALVNTATTDKKLIEAWPEIKEFIPADVLTKPKKQLPSVPVQELNNKLGLPTT